MVGDPVFLSEVEKQLLLEALNHLQRRVGYSELDRPKRLYVQLRDKLAQLVLKGVRS